MELPMQILSWLSRKPARPPSEATAQGFHLPVNAAALLNTPRRQELLENIWHRASLSHQQFNTLYRQPLERYAELVQLMPASENHHHAHLGGLLDHGLEIVAYALKIRQTYLLPIGAPPESQSAQAEAWTTAAAYGALLHDLGKVAVDIRVELQGGQVWHPWHGPIAKPYRFKYIKGREYQLHGAATALIYSQILAPEILDWLCGFPELWTELIYLVAGQFENAGILGEIVIKADSASVAQELGGNPDRAMAAPKQSLQRQLVECLRYLVREKFKLNHPDGPADGWLAEDALWLVSKPTADHLRAAMLSQGSDNIPSSNAPFFNMLQDQAIIQTNAKDKAVWKVTVDTGHGWKHSFTVLKVTPSLIWADPADRPEAYAGTVTVEVDQDGSEALQETTCAVPDEPIKAEPNVPAVGVNPIVAPPKNQKQIQTLQNIDSENSDIDELLKLYSNITVPAEGLSSSAGPGAASPLQSGMTQPEYTSEASAEPQALEDVTTMPSSISLGQGFVAWLKAGITSRKIIINDAKALVHTVDGTAMLVTPGIFKRYIQEHPTLEQIATKNGTVAWQQVQRAFEKEKLHEKTKKSLNIWTFNVSGPRKTKQLKGYLLRDPSTIFTEVALDNPSISRVEEGVSL
ncbi:relaxase [Pseudomonas protegens]|uniref:MobH family relaxase n=1 Tax=Pseudomonas protegens TaxID=380021 RepID=UPI0008070220|nr:relaxase [Pseudomonas protegens]OBZ21270.1 relaxase [Pseudomonas protegens]OKK40538.1 relaxase [Pseudomonas protegens]OKK52868.1 relaxase [Pseudomonas protegens]OKK58360.1 relaxase [Pseudomonas protegens]